MRKEGEGGDSETDCLKERVRNKELERESERVRVREISERD